MKEIIINKNDANQRLDKFITKYMPSLPKGMLYKGLRKNCVRVNGSHIKDGSYTLREGDRLTLYFRDEFFRQDSPKNTFTAGRSDIDVVYEDENIILINKPAGIVVHSDDRGTSDTLLSRMQSYLVKNGSYSPDGEHSFSPAFANRLDRNTEGIIIGAKNADALRMLNAKIKSREIKKYYLAVAEGITGAGGYLEAYLTRGEKKVSVSDTGSDHSKLIKTRYRTIASKNGASLLEIELETGRTHQIRAQLAHIGHPLCGDKKYGAVSGGSIMLASYKLRFEFIGDAGILNYLNGREFQIPVGFAAVFDTAKL